MRVLTYNAFTLDSYTWDNESNILNMNDYNFRTLIKDEGLEQKIIDHFQWSINKKIDPEFNIENGTVTFSMIKGKGEREYDIKISKGEENIFIWST